MFPMGYTLPWHMTKIGQAAPEVCLQHSDITDTPTPVVGISSSCVMKKEHRVKTDDATKAMTGAKCSRKKLFSYLASTDSRPPEGIAGVRTSSGLAAFATDGMVVCGVWSLI